MASSDSEGALEDEAPAQPGARAGEARGGDENGLGKVAGEPSPEATRAAEGGVDPGGVGGQAVGADGRRGEECAAHRGTDSLAGDVARQAGSVADQREAVARQSSRPRPPDGVRVTAKRRERE